MISAAFLHCMILKQLPSSTQERHTNQNMCLCQFVEMVMAEYFQCLSKLTIVPDLEDVLRKRLFLSIEKKKLKDRQQSLAINEEFSFVSTWHIKITCSQWKKSAFCIWHINNHLHLMNEEYSFISTWHMYTHLYFYLNQKSMKTNIKSIHYCLFRVGLFRYLSSECKLNVQTKINVTFFKINHFNFTCTLLLFNFLKGWRSTVNVRLITFTSILY